MIQAISQRRARRALSSEPVAREVVEQLLQAAHWAPSCANNQPWRFVLVDDPSVLTQVNEGLSSGNYWASTSPLIIAVVSKPELDCRIPDGRDYYAFGCGMATMNLMLEASQRGLIAHPIAGFTQAPIKKTLGIPDSFQLITLVICGYPAKDHGGLSEKHQQEESAPRIRRPLDEVLVWNRFTLEEEP